MTADPHPSPRPWRARFRDCGAPEILDNDGRPVEGVIASECGCNKCRANADLIVRAVNSYDACLTAMHRAAAYLEASAALGGSARIVWNELTAALALAEERP